MGSEDPRPGKTALGKPCLCFATFRLEDDGTLLRGETLVHLPPKELAALRLLLANPGRIVTPLELRQALWGDVHVTADSVPKCVSSLRARLEPEECIQTVYKRGYRFIASVRAQGSGTGGALPRLAIFPFNGGFGVPDHLGAVVAEETMARLGATRPASVSVLAQDSVFTLARRGLTALETGETLKADFVLAGTLRALPMHYRLRVEMIRVEDGTQVWVEDLLVERVRVAGLEAELADRLAFRLSSNAHKDYQFAREPAFGSATASATQSQPPPAADQLEEGLSISAVAEPEDGTSLQQREAYEIFQRAHHEWQTLERHRMQDGLQHLLRATELDPTLIEARVDLVNLCVAQSIYGYMSPMVAADIVRRSAAAGSPATGPRRWGADAGSPATGPRRRSDEQGAIRPEAVLPALGWVQFHFDRNLPAARLAYSSSAHLPHDQWITRTRVIFALSQGRFNQAIDLLRAAIELDPYSACLQARLAWALHLAGGVDSTAYGSASVDQIRKTLQQFPEDGAANLYGAIILAYNGEAAQATELARRLAQRLPYFDLATEVDAYALACAGRTDEAGAILERLQWLGRERFLLRAFMPAAYVALGDLDAALAELHASNQIRCPWFFQTLADPRLKPLHANPEFIDLQQILAGMEAEAGQDTESAEFDV